MNARLSLILLGAVVVGLAVYFLGFRHASAGSHNDKPSPAVTSSASAPAPSSAANSASPAAASTADSSNPDSSSTRGDFIVPTLKMQPLSQDDLQKLAQLPPQQQAEQMMMYAVNHYEGVPAMIMQRAAGWRGQVKFSDNWQTAELAARYSSDLRVRDAAIEVDLVIYQLDRNAATVKLLLDDAQTNVNHRGYDFNALGMLANRGVEVDTIHRALKDWAHNPDEGTRYWAIEGMAYMGDPNTVADFLDVLGHDPSMNVRQRCGASLAKSGMFTREQRMAAVPGLLDIAADSNEDSSTRGWAFQALHEITGENVGPDAAAWRTWYDAHGSERVQQFHSGDAFVVLGNS